MKIPKINARADMFCAYTDILLTDFPAKVILIYKDKSDY